jgi:DNA-binding transcriptional ArsR family regulator
MVKYYRDLNQTFAALADPIRRQMIERLARGSASVTELAAMHRVSLPGVLKHVRTLERAGLIETEKTGRVRRCRLSARPMRDAADWLEKYRSL